MALATAAGTWPGSDTGASSTKKVPPVRSSASRAATSTARRVLPDPPAPVTVTRRQDRTSEPTSACSASRPTKLLRYVGRLLVSSTAASQGSVTCWLVVS